MKTSELISALLDDLAEHGDRHVAISVKKHDDAVAVARDVADIHPGATTVFVRSWKDPE